MNHNKEAAYDEQIAPLMREIIAICHAENIQMLATFALIDADPAFDNEPLLCTSYVHSTMYNSLEILEARSALQV